MRVLHLYKNSLPESVGGVEQVIDQISRGTTALGVKNTVLSLVNSRPQNPSSFNGYTLFTAKRNFELASNGFSWEVIRLYKELSTEADLIHYHFPWPFADLIHLLSPPNKPSILTYHSDIVRQRFLLPFYRPIKQKFLKSTDKIVATSPNYLESSVVLQNFRHKSCVIPIGLDRQTYQIPPLNLVKYYQELIGSHFFLFIGAFRYYKGLQFLIESARLVPYPIVIAGSGPMEDDLKSAAKEHQLKNVFFLGQVNEEVKSSLLEACFGVICPSHLRSEAFGVGLLEGAMFGKPLISCEIGTGTSYINIHNETGVVVPPANPKALAHAMTWLREHPGRAYEMGAQAKERYESLFTAQKMAQSYFELYQKLVNQ